MKFTIEVEDFYMEEGDLESNLKATIIHSCVQKITTDLKTKIDEGVTKEVKAQVEQQLYRKIASFVSDCIANDKVSGQYKGDPEMTLQEWVKKQFVNKATDKAPSDKEIQRLAEQFGKDMHQRYDLLFASQLVAKLGDAGLLKEDAIKLLLAK